MYALKQPKTINEKYANGRRNPLFGLKPRQIHAVRSLVASGKVHDAFAELMHLVPPADPAHAQLIAYEDQWLAEEENTNQIGIFHPEAERMQRGRTGYLVLRICSCIARGNAAGLQDLSVYTREFVAKFRAVVQLEEKINALHLSWLSYENRFKVTAGRSVNRIPTSGDVLTKGVVLLLLLLVGTWFLFAFSVWAGIGWLHFAFFCFLWSRYTQKVSAVKTYERAKRSYLTSSAVLLERLVQLKREIALPG